MVNGVIITYPIICATTTTTTTTCRAPIVQEIFFPGGTKTCNSIWVTTSVFAYPNGCTMIERGIVYGLTPNPTILDNKVIQASITGEIITEVGNLDSNTGYYFCGYVTSTAGTNYLCYPYSASTINCACTTGLEACWNFQEYELPFLDSTTNNNDLMAGFNINYRRLGKVGF